MRFILCVCVRMFFWSAHISGDLCFSKDIWAVILFACRLACEYLWWKTRWNGLSSHYWCLCNLVGAGNRHSGSFSFSFFSVSVCSVDDTPGALRIMMFYSDNQGRCGSPPAGPASSHNPKRYKASWIRDIMLFITCFLTLHNAESVQPDRWCTT